MKADNEVPRSVKSSNLIGSPSSIGGVALGYGLSLLILGVSDLVLAHYLDSEQFGVYQYVRQLIPLLVIGALLGIEQSISRFFAGEAASSVAWARVLPSLVRNAALIATLAAVSAFAIQDLPLTGAWVIAFAVPFIVCSEYSAGYLKARGKYPLAALVQQGYRLALGAFVLLVVPIAQPSDSYFPGLIVLAAIPAAYAGVKLMRRDTVSAATLDPETYSDMRRIGLLIALSLITLGGLDWVDQATLTQRFESFGVTGKYASLKVYLAFPFVSLVSILGFAVLPEISKRSDDFRERDFLRIQRDMLGFGCLVASGLVLLYRSAPGLLPVDADIELMILLSSSGVARMLYVLPSGVLGASGTRTALTSVVGIGFLSLLIEASAIGTLPLQPTTLGAIGLLSGSLVRAVGANVLALKVLRNQGALDPGRWAVGN